jgi:PAS domain-containing protein
MTRAAKLAPAIAIASTAAALALALLFRPVLSAYSALLFILAVAVSALAGGVWPGLLAALLSALALNFWFFAPAGAFGFASPTDLVQQLVYWTAAVLVAAIVAQRRIGRLAAAAGESETAGGGTWEWSPGTGKVVLSPAVGAMHGLASERALDLAEFLDAIHPVDRERMASALSRSASDGVDLAIEYRVPHGGVTRLAVAWARVLEAGLASDRRVVGAAMLLPGPDPNAAEGVAETAPGP